MRTNFSDAQLADSDLRLSEQILRSCVECGFCNATCPTYVLMNDELDGPRGRNVLMRDMLASDEPPSAKVVAHIDRCLSCLACMTACPSRVDFMHLVDHARKHIERTFRRPLADRLLRGLIAFVLPNPRLLRLALLGARLLRPVARALPGRLKGMVALAPKVVPAPSPVDRPQVFRAQAARQRRVALLNGCAQRVLAPQINEATIRLLTRHGCEVVVAKRAGCCGALVYHMGKEAPALTAAKANIRVWAREMEGEGLDAVVVNASGCGTTVKDYGFMLRSDPAWAERAMRVAELTKDVSELMAELGVRVSADRRDLLVAYHAPCSLQHGQRIKQQPQRLLSACGFTVRDVPEGHMCCGSAGTYSLLCPEIAVKLRDRKVAKIERMEPDVIATGNIGCMSAIASATNIPVVHTVELLDWASGGPKPGALAALSESRAPSESAVRQ